jgi:hypothetical protein
MSKCNNNKLIEGRFKKADRSNILNENDEIVKIGFVLVFLQFQKCILIYLIKSLCWK